MKKFFLFFSILAALLAAVSGCGADKQKLSGEKNGGEQSEVDEIDKGDNPWNNEMFLEASVADLKIGQWVLIMASENEGGSVNALRIIIGDKGGDFEEMAWVRRPRASGNGGDDESRQPLSDFQGERPNFSRFQNLNEEERMKLREEMMARRGTTDGLGLRTMSANQNRAQLVGEIIQKDEASLTLRPEDGGSKLVFFQEATGVFKIKE